MIKIAVKYHNLVFHYLKQAYLLPQNTNVLHTYNSHAHSLKNQMRHLTKNRSPPTSHFLFPRVITFSSCNSFFCYSPPQM